MMKQKEGKGRDYDAKKRAAEKGIENPAAARVDSELRERLAEEYGEGCVFVERKGGEYLQRVNETYFAALFESLSDGVVYEIDEGRVYRYDPKSGLWRVRSSEQVLVEIDRFILSESRREGMEQLDGKRSLRQNKAVFEYARGIAGKRGVFSFKPESRERYIHLKNGVIPIRDGKICAFESGFSPNHYSRNQIPIVYDAKAKCPRFIDELLSPALPEETQKEDIELLAAFFGLFLLGVNLPQKLLILDGAAGSGKTTVAKIAGLLIGEDNRAMLRTDFLATRFELYGYLGKTLLMGADVEPKFLVKPGANMLKSLVGGDMLQAEGKHSAEMVPLRGCFNVIITANCQLRLKIENDRDAWRRRLAIVTFSSHALEKKIVDFENVLFQEEGAGIVNWALDGLRGVLSSVYDGDGGFPMSDKQKARVEELLAQSEALETFLRDRVEKADSCALTKKDLREGFWDYCRDSNWELPSKQEIGGRLSGLMKSVFGVAESNSIAEGAKQVQGYYGVAWRPEVD